MYGINAVISIEEDLKTCQIGMCSAAVCFVLETPHTQQFFDRSVYGSSLKISYLQ